MAKIMPNASLQNTVAIVVTFYPDSDFKNRVGLLCAQFPRVIIVDNTEGPDGELLDASGNKIIFLKNNSNLGIASALNQGLAKAKETGFDWAVTFDQDSTIMPGFLDELINTQTQLDNLRVVIGSNFFDKNRGITRFTFNSAGKQSWLERTTVITSGMLLPANMVSETGGFREDYFIDAVDHEFCLRARLYGYKVILACKPLMIHQIGHAFSPRLIGLKRYIPYSHSPLRKYYMVRNTCHTIKLYWPYEPVWCLRRIAALTLKLACIALESNPKKQLMAFSIGLYDGILGKLGKRKFI